MSAAAAGGGTDKAPRSMLLALLMESSAAWRARALTPRVLNRRALYPPESWCDST